MRRIVRILIWVAYLLAAAATALLAEGPAPAKARDSKAAVAEIAGKILKADYGDDRPALKRLYDELAPYAADEKIASRVRYWRGFAMWLTRPSPPPATGRGNRRIAASVAVARRC